MNFIKKILKKYWYVFPAGVAYSVLYSLANAGVEHGFTWYEWAIWAVLVILYSFVLSWMIRKDIKK